MTNISMPLCTVLASYFLGIAIGSIVLFLSLKLLTTSLTFPWRMQSFNSFFRHCTWLYCDLDVCGTHIIFDLSLGLSGNFRMLHGFSKMVSTSGHLYCLSSF